ncbi:lysM and putative peptidoglycan-binding domain-containing protein 3 isoform X4 [Octodon degus]|uniref:LysM and putative peptidoglycan-binding domain-containing protein 3 n=1 Tax=Octodon degus TaxID=10160 RepID=A0A6P6DJS6_OCTDE|nr:lysM and putative peptidoglycan-binding domain-containing protein 3 isoform X4 [Octodon degus]
MAARGAVRGSGPAGLDAASGSARDFNVMAGRHPNRSFPLPGAQSSGLDSAILEEDAEVYELRSRGKEKVRRSTSRDRLDDIVLLTKDIQEGDTLNAIALQYCCTVADIKRLNNLISDQDIFALRAIKIPVKKFSSLTESLYPPKGRLGSQPSPAQYAPEQQEILPANNCLSSSESAGSFLKEVDRDIEQIVKCTNTKKENLNEVVSALTTQQIRFEPDNKNTKPKVDVSHHHSTVDSSHLHSGVTPPSQHRELENGLAPSRGMHAGQQDGRRPYGASQPAAAPHRT